jgi:enoyl-[acyl-carrier-protein] reductase (NADH)
MTDDKLLEKVEELFATNNAILLTAMDKSMDKKIQASEKRLEEKIKSSQEDIISDVMNTGYNLHEDRIVRLENELDLPPLKQ